MGNLKHTPGPWFVSAGSKYVLAGGGTYRAVAEAFTCSDKWGMAPISEAERDANKRLIAAAPEMLEALKAVAVTDALHGMKTGGMDIMSLITNAIAKAEGAD